MRTIFSALVIVMSLSTGVVLFQNCGNNVAISDAQSALAEVTVVQGQQIELEWDANKEVDLSGYKVLVLNQQTQQQEVLTIESTESQSGKMTYQIDEMAVGEYTISVVAFNDVGLESSSSNLVNVSVK